MKKIAVLGSTGSIGTQTLDVIRANSDKLAVSALVAYSNADKLNAQAKEFRPEFTALISTDGEECLLKAVENCDVAVIATRGICAIDCVLKCLERNIDVAIANKETLVCAGELIAQKLKRSKSSLIPVDSEHFAISRCLAGRDKSSVKNILLTASGGPFWDLSERQLITATPADALKHPNWSMGKKITVDSATMMNKALEVIEARWLFDVLPCDIQIVVHRQSVVHSMVRFADGQVMAQLASPDMRVPIQAALLGQEGRFSAKQLDFENLTSLTFQKCDFAKFPCAEWGYKIFNYPPLCATVINGANDACVDRFLQGRLPFVDICSIITETVEHFAKEVADIPLSVPQIKKYDCYARDYAAKLIDGEI